MQRRNLASVLGLCAASASFLTYGGGCGPIIPPPAAIPLDGTRVQPEGTSTVSSYGGSVIRAEPLLFNWFGAQATYQALPELSLGGIWTRGAGDGEITQQGRLHLRYNPRSDYFALTAGASGGTNSARIFYGGLDFGAQGALFLGPQKGLELHAATTLSYSAALLGRERDDFGPVGWSVVSLGLLANAGEHLRLGADLMFFGLFDPFDGETDFLDTLGFFRALPSLCLSLSYRRAPPGDNPAAL
jgi:hypothetical protein